MNPSEYSPGRIQEIINCYHQTRNLRIISSTSQLPILDYNIPSLQYIPCLMSIIPELPYEIIIADPYLNLLVNHFLDTYDFCTSELCKTIPYCHPLWFALFVSNYIKSTPAMAKFHKNTYINPIPEFCLLRHMLQHAKPPMIN